jgi:hypothetical protein
MWWQFAIGYVVGRIVYSVLRLLVENYIVDFSRARR